MNNNDITQFIPYGGMMGGLFQLVAYGAQDRYLTGDPRITFTKVVYRKPTKDVFESSEEIKLLKSLVEQNNLDAMVQLAMLYEKEKYYDSMKKNYSLYIKSAGRSKLEDLIDKFKTNKKIKEFSKLYDECANVLYQNNDEECPICLFENSHYETQCCRRKFHCACLATCSRCPLCRDNKF